MNQSDRKTVKTILMESSVASIIVSPAEWKYLEQRGEIQLFKNPKKPSEAIGSYCGIPIFVSDQLKDSQITLTYPKD